MTQRGSVPTVVEAARAALLEKMEGDDGVLVLGEDVVAGGAFGLTKDLAQRFGRARVRNAPISEASIVGVGIGLALAGGRPLVEIMFDDFLTCASDQLVNHATKIHFMSGGRREVPMTIWTVGGAGTRWGAQHSQRLDGWLGQITGLKVLAPSTPAMAGRTMTAAIEDPDPVVVLVDRSLLYSRAALDHDDASPWSPRLVQRGDSVTVVTTGRLVHLACEVTRASGISADIVDLQRLAPLELGLVFSSVARTGRLLVVHDEAAGGAYTALVAREVYDHAYWYLDGPVVHITSAGTPVPAGPELEDAYMVTPEDLLDGLHRAMGL